MRIAAFLFFLIGLQLSTTQAQRCEIAMLSKEAQNKLEILKTEKIKLAEEIISESRLIERGLNLQLRPGHLAELMQAHSQFLAQPLASKVFKERYHSLLLELIQKIDQNHTQKNFEKIINTTENRTVFLKNMEASTEFPVLLMKTINDFMINQPPISEYHFWNTLLNHYKNIEFAQREIQQLRSQTDLVMERSHKVELKKQLKSVQHQLRKELLKSTNNNKALSNLSRIREKIFILRLSTPKTEKQRQLENQALSDLKLEFSYQLAEVTLHRRIEEESNGELSKNLLNLHTKSKNIEEIMVNVWEFTPRPQSPVVKNMFKKRRDILEQLYSE